MARFTFETEDGRTFADALAEHPSIDHFHVVETVTGTEYVFHLRVEDGRVFDDQLGDVSADTLAGYASVVGDEWHAQERPRATLGPNPGY